MKKKINIFACTISILSYYDTIKTMVDDFNIDNPENTTTHSTTDYDDELAVRKAEEAKKQDDVHSHTIDLDQSLQTEEEATTSDEQPKEDVDARSKKISLDQSLQTEEEAEKEKIKTPEKLKNLYSRLLMDEKKHIHNFENFQNLSAEKLMIIDKLISLPEDNRPHNVFVALDNMQKGENAWNSIQDNKFTDAIRNNYPAGLRIPDVIITAMNTSDDEFWKLIQDDVALAKTIEKNGVTFDKKTFKLLEFNSYFRSTYIRKKIGNPLHIDLFTKDYEKTICQMQWFLYKQAILEGKAFTSGMISFHDPENNVFKLMDRYMELVSPKFRFLGIIRSIGRAKAYKRLSSHYKDQTDLEGNNYGIDMDKNNPDLALPANKSHILFGMRTNGMMFVKWEDYGTTFNPIEGDYSAIPHLAGYFKKHGKEDNPLLERREKTPKEIEELFQEMYGKELTENQQQSIKTYGISRMITMLEFEDPNKAREFKQKLVQTFGYKEDTLPYRKGSEAIINPAKFIP